MFYSLTVMKGDSVTGASFVSKYDLAVHHMLQFKPVSSTQSSVYRQLFNVTFKLVGKADITQQVTLSFSVRDAGALVWSVDKAFVTTADLIQKSKKCEKKIASHILCHETNSNDCTDFNVVERIPVALSEVFTVMMWSGVAGEVKQAVHFVLKSWSCGMPLEITFLDIFFKFIAGQKPHCP